MRISTDAASVLFVPAALGISTLSVPLLRILGGNAYVQGSVPLTLMFITNANFVARLPLASALQGSRKTTVFILASSLALLSNFVLSVILIPYTSLVGAAIGYASISGVNFLTLYHYSVGANVMRVDLRMLSRIWASAITMAFVVFLLAMVTGFIMVLLPFYILTGMVVYFVMLRLTVALSNADRAFLLQLLPRGLELVRFLIVLL